MRKMKWTSAILAALIIIALCVAGVIRLIKGNERLRLLREQGIITKKDKPERQTPQATQTSTPTPSQAVTHIPITTESPSDELIASDESNTYDEENIAYPGGQDLDDYGDWLPPYEPPETEPTTTYRNETIIIPID